MTVAWEVIEPALRAFIESTGAVSAGHVYWERQAHAIAYEDVIELRILGEDSVGYDDVEDVEVEPGRFVPRITGYREFTLSVRYSSRTETTPARIALEKVRACLHHPRLTEQLTDAGIHFLSTQPLVTVDAVYEDRWQSVAVLDVRFSVQSELFLPDLDQSVPHLEAVGAEVRVVDAVGVTVADQTLSIPE